MYESCKVLIIKYIFIKSDSSTRTNTKTCKKIKRLKVSVTNNLFVALTFIL